MADRHQRHLRGPQGRSDAGVAAWHASIDDAGLSLGVLVPGEVRRRIERARPTDPARARALEAWLTAVRAAFAGRILPVDDAVVEEWGRIGAGRPIPTVTGLLAATARVHGMTLATRNVADVAGLGADVLNPFERPSAGQ